MNEREFDPRRHRIESHDEVRHPHHYTHGRNHEPINVIEDWKLDFHLGQVIKYISRAGRKVGADELVDLRKAKWYLERKISILESQRFERKPGSIIETDDPFDTSTVRAAFSVE